MVHVWIMLRYYISFETTTVQSATSWLRVAREWHAEESHRPIFDCNVWLYSSFYYGRAGN